MRKLILAAALVAPLVAAPLTAMAQDMDEMQALTMLEANTKNALEGFGIETDVQTLSIGQLGAIHGVLSSEESEGRKGARIMAIINNN